jgi:hypothetical protein
MHVVSLFAGKAETELALIKRFGVHVTAIDKEPYSRDPFIGTPGISYLVGAVRDDRYWQSLRGADRVLLLNPWIDAPELSPAESELVWRIVGEMLNGENPQSNFKKIAGNFGASFAFERLNLLQFKEDMAVQLGRIIRILKTAFHYQKPDGYVFLQTNLFHTVAYERPDLGGFNLYESEEYKQQVLWMLRKLFPGIMIEESEELRSVLWPQGEDRDFPFGRRHSRAWSIRWTPLENY